MDLDDFSQIFGNRKSIWIIGKLNEKNPVYEVGQVDIAVEQCDLLAPVSQLVGH